MANHQFWDSRRRKTVNFCEGETTRKGFLVLISLLSEWHWFIHPVISMHTTLTATNSQTVQLFIYCSTEQAPRSLYIQENESYCNTALLAMSLPASFILFGDTSHVFPSISLLRCLETVLRWGFQGDRAWDNTVGRCQSHFIPVRKDWNFN